MSKPTILVKPILFLFLIGSLCACNQNVAEEDYVARVYDNYLTKEILANQIPATASPDDSLKRAKVFINSWIKDQVVLHKAKFNLKEDDEKFQSKLTAYLNDLMIFEYERELIRQNLDTAISRDEMMKFYDEHKQNFILKDYVVRMRYLVAPDELDGIKKYKAKFKNYDETDSLDVLNYVETNALLFRDNPTEWVFVPKLLEVIPINFSYFEEKVKQKKYFEKTLDGNTYILYVRDFKVRDGESPFELEKQRIKSIIINTRKQELLATMRDKLFQDALESAQIEIKE